MATYNREHCISGALDSIKKQSFQDYELVVIDGKSSDKTLDIVESYNFKNIVIVSEKDDGIYDALNKGIKLSNGEVVGVLHSDDFFANNDVLKNIHDLIKKNDIHYVYGNLQYVSNTNSKKVVRTWISSNFHKKSLFHGWMPPHPTLFIKRDVLDQIGMYDQKYQISADYDFILRLFNQESYKGLFLNKIIIKMMVGGESNKNIFKIFKKSYEDYKIIKKHKIGGFYTLLSKNLTKINQFFIVK